MTDRVLVLSDNQEIFNFIKNSLGYSISVEKASIYESYPAYEGFQFIFAGCDYKCSLEVCLRNFFFFYQNREIPIAIIRPLLFKKACNSINTFFLSFLSKYDLSLSQENILETIKNSIYYGCSSRWIVHPLHPFFKIARVQREIVENPHKNLDLCSLANLVNLSRSWLSFKFKNMSGISLERFLIKIKICTSFWEVLSTEKKIKTIAAERGYTDFRSFTKRFHSIFGAVPSSVREKVQMNFTKNKATLQKNKLS